MVLHGIGTEFWITLAYYKKTSSVSFIVLILITLLLIY